MKIAIIGKDNGVGLEKDYLILKRCLEPFYQITYRCLHRPFNPLSDEIRIFLEAIDIRYLGKHNVLIPNQEWFYKYRWLPLLRHFSVILTKSKYATDIFKNHHGNVRYIGFSSFDFFVPVEKKLQFFHSQGKSIAKNTQLILDSWLPEYPPLICISQWKKPLNEQSNIIFIDKFVDEELYKRLLNESLVCLCPSQNEGFGHYISEAKSTGNVVVTTDAPPMNELIHSFLCQTEKAVSRVLTFDCDREISVGALRAIIDDVLSYSISDLKAFGKHNRQEYLTEKICFEESLLKEMKILERSINGM